MIRSQAPYHYTTSPISRSSLWDRVHVYEKACTVRTREYQSRPERGEAAGATRLPTTKRAKKSALLGLEPIREIAYGGVPKP